MRIALLLGAADPGGVLRVNEALADRFVESGHAVTVVSVTPGRLDATLATGRRWQFTSLGVRRLAISVRRMRRLAMSGFDVIVVSQFHVGVVLTLLRPRRSATAIVWVDHTSLESWRTSERIRDRVVERLARVLCPRVEVLAAVSRATTDAINREFRRLRWPAILLSNPVLSGDEPVVRGEPDDRSGRRDLLFVGRLVTQKRVDLVLDAFAAISDVVADDLVVIGDGPELDELRRRAARLGIGDRVRFTGYHPDPPSEMDRFAVLVLASDHEGFGVVLVEALAHGCAVVATDCPTGPSEILDGGRFGRLVPVGDVPALARALEDSLTVPRPPSPGLAEHLHPFTVESAAAVYEDAMRTAVDRRRARRA